MENKIRDMTELYASETILARFINPTVISSAELQVNYELMYNLYSPDSSSELLFFHA